ncbi:MAG: TMEM165/GDT1 family protein [Bdellovibrionales bacterium]
MTTFANSFVLVFVGEMGDKTQLLALLLAARFRRPWTILFGILVATLLNHALSAWAGERMAAVVDPTILRWLLAATFFIFAAWILVPDKNEELQSERTRFGPLLTTIIVFFLAEIGDKTQLTTVALGARFPNVALVTLGTTLGMLAANAMAIFLGDKLLERIPMRYVRWIASGSFAVSGLIILMFPS